MCHQALLMFDSPFQYAYETILSVVLVVVFINETPRERKATQLIKDGKERRDSILRV